MFKFTTSEIRDLIISFLVISLGFCILYSRDNLTGISYIIPMIMVGVGLGFIFHEIGHKIVSMHYGYWAEYKLWTPGLIISLLSSFLGFIFAAPGAVYIYGPNMSDKENGIISIAGPIVNIILAIIFIIIFHIVYGPILSFWGGIIVITCLFGATINSFLALFNLLPILMLDGAKIFRWNKLVWLITIAIAGILVLYTRTGMRIA